MQFKKYLRILGIHEKYHFHCLRHTFITNLIKKGVNINFVKEIAGHTDIETTMNYIHIVTEDLRKAVNLITL
jgi:site-specific recombinase XerD